MAGIGDLLCAVLLKRIKGLLGDVKTQFADKIGVAGLPFDGMASLDFAFHRALLTAQLTLPNFFATAGGEPFNARVVLHTDNGSGLALPRTLSQPIEPLTLLFFTMPIGIAGRP